MKKKMFLDLYIPVKMKNIERYEIDYNDILTRNGKLKYEILIDFSKFVLSLS